jgi:colicin import membrane protein
MSTVVNPQTASPAAEKEDPWRYGWRYVRQTGPDGETRHEQVPLTEEDLLFPEEGDFAVNTQGHNNDCHYLKTVLGTWAAARKGFLVLSDHRVDWQYPGLRPLGPDVAVFGGLSEAWDPWRGTFPVVDFGAQTLLVVEVTSPDTRANDLGVKVDFYHRVGVAFYAVVDRHMGPDGPNMRLFGYRNTPDGYEPVPLNSLGRLWLEPLKLWLAIEGEVAVCYDDKGDKLKDYAELMQDIKAAEARTKELEAELERLRDETRGNPANPAAP